MQEVDSAAAPQQRGLLLARLLKGTVDREEAILLGLSDRWSCSTLAGRSFEQGTVGPTTRPSRLSDEYVYDMCMLTERLQVLLSRAQRHRLAAEARRRRMSVGALIREAVDARLHSLPLEKRRRAVAEIKAMSGGRFLSVRTLERIVEEEREKALRQHARLRRR